MSGTPAKDMRYRFQWTAPIADLAARPKGRSITAPTCSFRTTDRGEHWDVISPDLTRNDKSKQQWTGGPITGDITGVEVYDTIFSIAESPAAAGEIWVGTDDGLVQLTRDDGKTWKNVTPPKLPEWATIEASSLRTAHAGTAYVVTDAHRLDDIRPYLYRTRDFGQSWEQLGKDLPDDQHLYVVREDPTDPSLLYVGSERGLYWSRDAGESFHDLRNNLPAVGVADIEVKHDDLILGTRRGIWILDDLSALRAFTPGVRSEPAHLFTPRPAYRFRSDVRGTTAARARPQCAARHADHLLAQGGTKDEPDKPPHAPLKLEIYDAHGQLVRTLSSVVKPNRYLPGRSRRAGGAARARAHDRRWASIACNGTCATTARRRLADAKVDSGDPDKGPLVLPGDYTLKLTVDGQTQSADRHGAGRSAQPGAGLAAAVEHRLHAAGALGARSTRPTTSRKCARSWRRSRTSGTVFPTMRHTRHCGLRRRA